MGKAILKINIKHSHPDYNVAREQSIQSRRLYNGLIALSREAIAYYKDQRADTFIAKDLGLETLEWVQSNPFQQERYAFEKLRKVLMREQDINLPHKAAQHVAQSVSKDIKSIIELRKKGSRANYPNYKREYSQVHFTKQAFSQRKNSEWVKPSGWSQGVKLPNHIRLSQVQATTLIPVGSGFELVILYNKPDITYPPTGEYKAAIDLGVNNFATIVTTVPEERPKIVSGKYIKTLNQFANKKIAILQGKLDLERNNIWNKIGGEKKKLEYPYPIKSKRKSHLWVKRNRRVNHYLHSASTVIANYLLHAGVNELTIGWSTGFKYKVKMGKKNTQNFATIPHARFRDEITRKCKERGIKVIIIEESYTSKASFIDDDILPVYKKANDKFYNFNGKRIKRGLYKSHNGLLIHADVNGAWNILRKSNPTIRWSSGIIVMPERLIITC